MTNLISVDPTGYAMNEPFFSILLPTRNRSEIVGAAIASVLGQSFRDWELIISDNDESSLSYSPTATRSVVDSFRDSRIKYVRSGGLKMYENWQNALEHSTGRFIYVLEDKVRLVPDALVILHSHLRILGDVVLSFNLAFCKGDRAPESRCHDHYLLKSSEVLDMFCKFEPKVFKLLPKGLDCITPRSLVKRRPFFDWVCPDYSSAFYLLSTTRQYYRIEDKLAYIPNGWMSKGMFSNGQASYKMTPLFNEFIDSLPISRSSIRNVMPVRTEFLWLNLVMWDYYSSDNKKEIAIPSYFAFCWYCVLLGKRMGAPMKVQSKAIWEGMKDSPVGFKLLVMWKLMVIIFKSFLNI